MKDFKTRILSADYGKRFRLLIAAGLCILLIGGGTSAVLLHTVDANAFTGNHQMQMHPGDMSGGGSIPGSGNTPGNGNAGNNGMPGGGNAPDYGNNGGRQFGHGHGGPGQFGNDQNGNAGEKQTPPQQDNGSTPSTNNNGRAPSDSSSDTRQDTNTKGTVAQMVDYQGTGGPLIAGRGMHHSGFISMILHNSQISIASKIAVLTTTVLGILWIILAWYTIVCYLYRTSTFSRMNRVLWTVLGVFGSVLALIAFFIARSIIKVRCGNCDSWQDADQEFCSDCGAAMRQKCDNCGTSVMQSAAFCPSCGRRLGEKSNAIEECPAEG